MTGMPVTAMDATPITTLTNHTTTVDPAARNGGGRVASPRTYLMCRPDHFDVSYAINPWMDPTAGVDVALARRQWEDLYRVYTETLGHTVEVIEPAEGLPDMVFAANGGFTVDGLALGARFAHAERLPEREHYLGWFADHGFTTIDATFVNEGEGDFALAGDVVLAGTGFRSDPRSHGELAAVFGREVVGLRLVNRRYYHLDTALTVLDPAPGDEGANIAYLPSAFDRRSRAVLAHRFPDAIRVGAREGAVLALNAVSDGANVVVPTQAPRFARDLAARGYTPIPVDMSEFLRAGGGARCCTLELRR